MAVYILDKLRALEAAFLSEQVKRKVEVTIIGFAIFAFVIHLLLIMLVELNWIQIPGSAHLLSSPISTIYTPFSFILFYEVYLLVFYLPRSTSIYIAKQYEIITLIVIRRAMKDLSSLSLDANWFHIKQNQQFTADILSSLALFFLILLFYRLNQKKSPSLRTNEQKSSLARFIRIKGLLSLALLPVLIVLAMKSLINWSSEVFLSMSKFLEVTPDTNKIFFEDFFTILILVDVLILLISFLNTDKFYKVMRNSGFVISTILIKLSFAAEGFLNSLLVVAAVMFGVAILWTHNQFEKLET
jgi:hypothetical protein